jgi:hypothetical protein
MASRFPDRITPPSGAVPPHMRHVLGRLALWLVAVVLAVVLVTFLMRRGSQPGEPRGEPPGTEIERLP